MHVDEEREEKEEEEKEKYDDIKAILEKKSAKNLQHKRSFFVRMVSDPKLYNPHILTKAGLAGGQRVAKLRQNLKFSVIVSMISVWFNRVVGKPATTLGGCEQGGYANGGCELAVLEQSASGRVTV